MASGIASGLCRVRLLPKNVNPTRQNQTRSLYLAEHHSQNLLKKAGVAVPQSYSATQIKSVASGMRSFERPEAFFKEERLTGRRHSELIYGQEYARRFAATILPLEDSRSYAKGELQPRTTVYVQEKVSSDIHWRLTMTIDRKTCRPVVKIKDVSKDDPPTGNSKEFQKDYLFNFSDEKENILDMIREMKRDLRLGKASKQSFQKAILELHKLFTEAQAISLEVDVLRRRDGKILCANSRFLFDDDAPNRATKIYMKLREPVLEDKSELYAEAFGLVYVKMRGNIGTVVNGAGLAMATNDAIHLYGGSSANFLDAGGQATKDTMLEAFKIVMDDERVRTIFVNIYGGITRCDMIAESIIAAASELGPLQLPMVVRLQGTNSEAGLKLLEDANLGIHVEADFGEAAKKAVELAEKTKAPPPRHLPKIITKESLHGAEKLKKLKDRKAKKKKAKKKAARDEKLERLKKAASNGEK